MAPFFRARRAGERYVVEGETKALVGHKLERRPEEVPDGIFAEWSWDGVRLVVQTDRYGFCPLYLFVRAGEICVSTSIAELLAHGASTELDEPALATFLRLGFFLREETPFRHVRAAPPNAKIEWVDDRLQVSGGRFLTRPSRIGREEAIEGYLALVRSAVHRRLPGTEDFAVPLSGGRDSRHILLELCEAGYPPKVCVTVPKFPPFESEDVQVATSVAGALGMKHVVLRQPKSQLAAELRKNRATSFCAWHDHAWHVALADYLQGRVSLVYDGIGGDVLSQGRGLDVENLTLFDSGAFTALAEKLIPAKTERALALMLRPSEYRRFGRDQAIQCLVDELRTHAEAPNPMGSFYFWTQTRRGVAPAPFGLLDRAGGVYAPYLDHDLYDFTTSLPASLLLGRTFHTDAIRRGYPRHADIPFERWDLLPEPARGHRRRFAFDLAAYAVSGGRSRLIRTSYVVPRLLRGVIDGNERRAVVGPLLTYLLQLERVRRRCP